MDTLHFEPGKQELSIRLYHYPRKSMNFNYYACYTTALDTFLSLGTISSKIREDAGLRKIFLGELCDLLEHYKPSIRYKVGRIIDNLTGKQRIGHVWNQTDSYQYWENIDIKKLKNDNDIL